MPGHRFANEQGLDILEYSPFAIQLAYRGATPYQGTAPGARHLKVFTNPGGTNMLKVVRVA